MDLLGVNKEGVRYEFGELLDKDSGEFSIPEFIGGSDRIMISQQEYWNLTLHAWRVINLALGAFCDRNNLRYQIDEAKCPDDYFSIVFYDYFDFQNNSVRC